MDLLCKRRTNGPCLYLLAAKVPSRFQFFQAMLPLELGLELDFLKEEESLCALYSGDKFLFFTSFASTKGDMEEEEFETMEFEDSLTRVEAFSFDPCVERGSPSRTTFKIC